MALRTRETKMVHSVIDQENMKYVLRGKKPAVAGPSRPVLRDATQIINKPKVVTIAKKEPLPKPAAVQLQTKELKKPIVYPATTKGAKLPVKVTAVKPFLSGRALGLNKKDDVASAAPEPAEKPVALVQPTEPLLDNVCDIDKEDVGKAYLVSEYANEIYAYLRQLENKYRIKEYYLSDQKITPRMRATLVDWMVELQQQYHLLSETLHLSIGILDMFLQKVKTVTKDRLQLVGVSAMLVACKYEETYTPDVSDFVYITDNSYTKDQILAMEKYICDKLDFGLGRPLSIHFLRRYSKAAQATPTQHTISKYFLELALVEHQLAHVKPSLVAAVACYLSLLITSADSTGNLWTPTLITYSTYTIKDLKPWLPTMASIVVKAANSKLKTVYHKYSTSKFQKVSLLPAMESERLKKLAEHA